MKNSKQITPATPKLSRFAKALLREWRKLNLPADNQAVLVAVSGGADSSALLFALDEVRKSKKLLVKIVVAHLNHKLRGKASTADARWVTQTARDLGYRVVTKTIDVNRLAIQTRDNLEQAGRIARYKFLKAKAKSLNAVLIVTAHTLDDQAETILLNLLRGSGAGGLTGIDALSPLDSDYNIQLARPLLSWATRAATEDYCRQRSIDFRVDQMNADESLARVRVRRQILPLLKTFNPRIIETLARTAEILREDSAALDAAASRVLELSFVSATDQKSIRADIVKLAPPALRKRAIRLWVAINRGNLRRLERVHIEAIERLIFSPKSGRLAELPGGAAIERTAGSLHYRKPGLRRRS